MRKINRKAGSTFSLVVVVLLVLCCHSPLFAEEDTSTGSPGFPLLNRNTIQKRITEIQKAMKLAGSVSNAQTATLLGVPLISQQDNNANLRKLETVYKRQITALEREASLRREEESLGKLLVSRQENILDKPPPYNLSLFDGLLGELTTRKLQKHTLEIALRTEKKVLEEWKIKVEREGKKVRDAKEKQHTAPETDKALQLGWNLQSELVAQELATAFLDLKRIVVTNLQTETELASFKERITQRHVAWVQSRLAFDQTDRDRIITSLEKRRRVLQADISALQQGQEKVENEWLLARKKLEEAMEEDEAARNKASAFLAAREAWRQTYQKVLEQSQTVMLFMEQEKQFWLYRYSLLEKNVSQKELADWEEQVAGNMHNIERHIELNEQYHTDLQSEIAALQKQLNFDQDAQAQKKHVATQLQALRKMAERGFEHLALLQGTRAVGKRLLTEINMRQQDGGLQKRIEDIRQLISRVWEVELWVVDERSVTVHKLAIALLIFVSGMVFVRLFIRLFIRRFLARTQLDTSASIAIERIIFWVVLVGMLIAALRLVNIPLAVFTVFGGGIALGLGFGARNLINNFISGFILMAERPVKINDMIEVDDNFGIIENIGMRCTRVRTSGNIHILVPNSSFLEKNIVNWTLSDQEIRAKVVVRVAQNSDPEEVKRLVLQAARENSAVLHSPQPIVLFDEMLSSSLRFILYFWVSMKNLQLLERRAVESAIRFRIIALFRKAGVTLAQPHSNVHFEALSPIDLQVKLAN
jgi:small-conductance mechanosensitive channel